jgi:hypothetical protein
VCHVREFRDNLGPNSNRLQMDAIKDENGKSSRKTLDESSEESVLQTEVESVVFSQAELLSSTAQAVMMSAS